MELETLVSQFDPRVEDPHALRQLSRRGFLGGLIGSAAWGSTLLSFGTRAMAAAPVPLIGQLSPEAAPDNERYWEGVASQFLLRKGVSYMNTGTDRKSTRLNSSHIQKSRMPSSA